jgi:hypothetical protein
VNNESAFDKRELRNRRDWKGLKAYCDAHPPKVHLWITDSHLVPQAVAEAAKFTNTFRMFVYRSDHDKAFPLPEGVRELSEAMTADSEIMEGTVLKEHTVIFMSKGVVSSRHGPRPAATFVTKATRMATAVAKSALAVSLYPPPGFPYVLIGHIGVIVIDEAHNIGGEYVDVWVAIRWFHADFHVVLTATPVPWAGEKLVSIISVLQDPELELQAQELAKRGQLSNPYAEGTPDDAPECLYRATTTAFKMFYNRHASVIEQGRILHLVLQGTMLRRTYESTCVTHPNGDVHSLSDLMPPSIPIRIHVENIEAVQHIWANESLIPMRKLYYPAPKTRGNADSSMLVNGKWRRVLNLASYSVLLFFATAIHDVTDNDEIVRLNNLHDKAEYAAYLHSILENVFDEAVLGKHYEQLFPFKDSNGRPRPPDINNRGELVYSFSYRSERIKLALAILTDWVARSHDKVIVWCLSPSEQEIQNCILNLCGIRSVALLARYDSATRAGIIQRFNTPLAASQGRTVSKDEYDQEIEVIVLSINKNTGLNLNICCCRMLFMGPCGSDAIFCQCCGRIVRIGQGKACVMIEIYDPNSYNQMVFQKAVRRALPMLAALTNVDELMRLIAPDYDEDDEIAGAPPKPISTKNLTGFHQLPDDSFMHENNRDFPTDGPDTQRLEPEALLAAIYAQLNSKSYLSSRNPDGTVSISATKHAAQVMTTPVNTPQKRPGIYGDRATDSRALIASLNDIEEVSEEDEFTMDVEVDAAPGETLTKAAKRGQAKRERAKRLMMQEDTHNTRRKRMRIRDDALRGARRTLGYRPGDYNELNPTSQRGRDSHVSAPLHDDPFTFTLGSDASTANPIGRRTVSDGDKPIFEMSSDAFGVAKDMEEFGLADDAFDTEADMEFGLAADAFDSEDDMEFGLAADAFDSEEDVEFGLAADAFDTEEDVEFGLAPDALGDTGLE